MSTYFSITCHQIWSLCSWLTKYGALSPVLGGVFPNVEPLAAGQVYRRTEGPWSALSISTHVRLCGQARDAVGRLGMRGRGGQTMQTPKNEVIGLPRSWGWWFFDTAGCIGCFRKACECWFFSTFSLTKLLNETWQVPWTLAKFKQSHSWFDQTAAQPWWGSRIPNGSAGWWAKWDNSFWSSLLGEVSDVFLWYFSISNFTQRVALQVSENDIQLWDKLTEACHLQVVIESHRPLFRTSEYGNPLCMVVAPLKRQCGDPAPKKSRRETESRALPIAVGSNWEKIEFLTVGKNITGKPSQVMLYSHQFLCLSQVFGRWQSDPWFAS